MKVEIETEEGHLKQQKAHEYCVVRYYYAEDACILSTFILAAVRVSYRILKLFKSRMRLRGLVSGIVDEKCKGFIPKIWRKGSARDVIKVDTVQDVDQGLVAKYMDKYPAALH